MTRQNGRRPARTAREVLDRKQPVQHRFRIALESKYADDVAAAEKAIEELDRDLRLGRITTEQYQLQGGGLHDKLDEARAAYEENSVEFVAQALGRGQLDDLMKAHAPTAEQQAAFQELVANAPLAAKNGELAYNTETLPPALIAASLLEPKFTLAEADELWTSEAWSDAELATLMNACWAVNKMLK